MTIRALSLFRAFHSSLLAAMLLFPFAGAHAQAQAGGQRAFWCKNPNGVAALQLESCAPGMELRSEPVGPHGMVASPRPAQPAVVPEASVVPKAPDAARPSSPAVAETVAAPGKEPRGNILTAGLFSIIRLLGFGLVLALIGRLMGRSFWRWLFVGCLLWIVLALLKVVKF